MRKLGDVQRECLIALQEHGDWHPSGWSGWVWDNRFHTKKVLDSLVKRNLVEINEKGFYCLTQEGKKISMWDVIKDFT
jgi:hypothetical protein